MARLQGWRGRLNAVLLEAVRRPFSWGESDCCTGLVFPAIEAVTGVDLGGPYRGKYRTARGAFAALKRQGHDGILELFQANFEECPVAQARAGDVVGLQSARGEWAMGVVIGARAAVLHPDGYATLDLLAFHRAFRVG